ncbi:MAG: 16S rRNA (cytidine(1402)-2'-O)-methyltransferase [Candidatus Omnitrophota bacterium]
MLYIIATSIGNLEDITLRALRVLGEADFILAEDTRKTSFLLKHFNINKKVISFYEHNEVKKISWVIEELKSGKNIALVSSAGTPTISDPGYKLIRECRNNLIELTSLPGPSSIINALSLTSLAHEKFIFLGYAPRKKGRFKKMLEKVKDLEAAIIFLESPFRLLSSLKVLKEILGNRKIACAREMTKKFEEILELNIESAVDHFEKTKPRGEFTLIIDRL